MLDTWRSPVGCTSCPADVTPFRTWCKRRKVHWDKCKIDQSDTTGRCVVATEAIREGDVAVEVPDDAVLMSENSTIAEELAGRGCTRVPNGTATSTEYAPLLRCCARLEGGVEP
jgi:SET domain-containing protein 6